jgi:hypothetical protein
MLEGCLVKPGGLRKSRKIKHFKKHQHWGGAWCMSGSGLLKVVIFENKCRSDYLLQK